VSPQIACDQQLTSPITVSGMNFTPLPVKTLQNKVGINLPQVSLLEETDLFGGAASPAPMSIAIFDDPNNPSTSHIRWESEQQLGFDVYPDLMLTPGVYDVTVKNPDGQSSSFKDALAVVPPPTVISVVPANICDAQSDQVVMVTGTNFLEVGTMTPTVTILDGNKMVVFTATSTPSSCTQVAASVASGIQECTSLDFTIPVNAIPVGTYSLVVTNPAPAACASTEMIKFVVEPPPTLTGVLPTHICEGGGTLHLTGTNFLPGATAKLTDNQNSMTYDANPTTVTDSMNAFGRFFTPGGFTVGDTMDVTIQNADGCLATLPKAVTVEQGPIIFYVDPPFVYGNITTPVTVYTTGLTDTIASSQGVLLIPDISPIPSPSPATIDLTANSSIDPNHPKRVIIDAGHVRSLDQSDQRLLAVLPESHHRQDRQDRSERHHPAVWQ
jgi:hypothetical protein